MKDMPISFVLSIAIAVMQIPLLFGFGRIYWHFEKRARWIDWAWDNLPIIWPFPFLVLGLILWHAIGQHAWWEWVLLIGTGPVVFAMCLALIAYEP